jgi:chemotaxis protein histidine kinase CheA
MVIDIKVDGGADNSDPLAERLREIKGLAGGAIMGHGRVGVIMKVSGTFEMWQVGRRRI